MNNIENSTFFLFKGRYFDEISQDTGKYCFGVDDTLKAMEMGAVDTLIVWENLDIQRFVLKNHSTDGLYLSACNLSIQIKLFKALTLQISEMVSRCSTA